MRKVQTTKKNNFFHYNFHQLIKKNRYFFFLFFLSEGDLALVVVAYLVEISTASDKAVRFRTSQLIGGIINNLQGDVDISEDLFALIG